MAVTTLSVDGTGQFGITTPTAGSMAVESFTETQTGERVDLNNGSGQPVGSVTIPGRTEMSATLQMATASLTLTVGATLSIGGGVYYLSEVSLEETQADYQRVNVSGYKKIGT